MSQPSAFARRIVSSAVLAATLGLSGCFGLAVTGAAIGTVAVLDRRSIGAQTEDETIELRGARVLNESVNKDPMASVAITSFNRRALLTGQVPTEEMRAQAEEIVRTRVPKKSSARVSPTSRTSTTRSRSSRWKTSPPAPGILP